MSEERIPPYNLDGEEAVLGSILIDPEAAATVFTLLKPSDFYRDKYQWIYESALTLFNRSEPVNSITVQQELRRTGRDVAMAALSEIINNTPTSVHAEHYSGVVKNLALLRHLIATTEVLQAKAYTSPPDAGKLATEGIQELLAITQGQRTNKGFQPIREIADTLFTEVEALFEKQMMRGITTGFRLLDRATGGLVPGWMYVIAGRPSMGKTQCACEMARRMAVAGHAVGIVSLEDTKVEVADRMACAFANISQQRLRLDLNQNALTMEMRDEFMAAYIKGIGHIYDLPILIDDNVGQTVAQIRAKMIAQQQRGPLAVVFIDHMSLAADQGENDVKRLDKISQGIRDCGKELNIPTVVLCQINRAVESRENRRPTLSDLRGSGALEQNANVVMGLYREAYYEPDKEIDDRPGQWEQLEIIWLKNKRGARGQSTFLKYNPGTGKIEE